MLQPVSTIDPSIHFVGLGPGDPGLLTGETRALLAASARVIVRTRHHPAVAELDADASWTSCDDLEAALDETCAASVERVLAAAQQGPVVYAVPGHPLADPTVLALVAAAKNGAISYRIHPALGIADVAAVALGVDPTSLQLCDVRATRIDTQRPALVTGFLDPSAAAALRARLSDIYPAEHPVTILAAPGTSHEKASTRALNALDPGLLGATDCLYLPPLDPLDDVRRFDGLFYVVERLNGPGGCPWDLEQDHRSLRPYLLEETYEALHAIESGDTEAMAEELGDVLFQVLIHAEVGKRQGEFHFADIAERAARKLISRHPHVFGTATASTAEEVARNWEALKQVEKPRTSILDGVPPTLPALAASQSIQGRARRVGFDWPDIEGPLDKLAEEIAEFARADGVAEREDEFGDILFVITNIADHLGIDAEQALRGANEKFRRRFGRVETMSTHEGVDLKELDLAALDALWDRAKAEEAAGGR
jgi:tetrapyrrole methylase family protein/MazG family protein